MCCRVWISDAQRPQSKLGRELVNGLNIRPAFTMEMTTSNQIISSYCIPTHLLHHCNFSFSWFDLIWKTCWVTRHLKSSYMILRLWAVPSSHVWCLTAGGLGVWGTKDPTIWPIWYHSAAEHMSQSACHSKTAASPSFVRPTFLLTTTCQYMHTNVLWWCGLTSSVFANVQHMSRMIHINWLITQAANRAGCWLLWFGCLSWCLN